MQRRRIEKKLAGKNRLRRGLAATEFAVSMPVIVLLMAGLWEVGRIVEVQQVMWNSAREASRDASLGQDNLQAVANNLLNYLQGAEPTAFGTGHATSMIAPVVSLPANTTGYTCWDNTANRELFTLTFTDMSNTNVTDPTGMSQLDVYQIGVQAPYSSFRWSPLPQITGMNRVSVAVVWVSMVDSPFEIANSLPAE